jgi:hypothetical protein
MSPRAGERRGRPRALARAWTGWRRGMGRQPGHALVSESGPVLELSDLLDLAPGPRRGQSQGSDPAWSPSHSHQPSRIARRSPSLALPRSPRSRRTADRSPDDRSRPADHGEFVHWDVHADAPAPIDLASRGQARVKRDGTTAPPTMGQASDQPVSSVKVEGFGQAHAVHASPCCLASRVSSTRPDRLIAWAPSIRADDLLRRSGARHRSRTGGPRRARSSDG